MAGKLYQNNLKWRIAKISVRILYHKGVVKKQTPEDDEDMEDEEAKDQISE